MLADFYTAGFFLVKPERMNSSETNFIPIGNRWGRKVSLLFL